MRIQEKTDECLELEKAREELRSIEERYRAIFHNAAVGIDLVSGEGRFLETNSTLQDMLGYTEEELKGLSLIDITFPEDIQISKEKLDALTKGVVSSYKLEKRYVRKDGSLLWADISTSAIRGSDGRHIATIGVISDITQHKRAQEALRESEERFRNFLNATDDLAFIKDQHYRYVFVNKANQDFFGLSEHDIIGKTDFELMPEKLAIECLESDQRAVADNNIVTTQERSTERIFEIRKFPVRLAYEEIGVGAFIRDITDRKRAEEAVESSENFLEQIVENLPDMVFVKEAKDLRFVRFNKAGEVLLGYSREDLLGKNDHDFFPLDQADFFIAKDKEVLASGKLTEIHEEEIETRLKGKRILHTKKIPILDTNGKPQFLLGISRDITDRKLSEQERENLRLQLFQSQKMEALGTLVGGIAHDFNNMLQVILGYSDLLLSDKRKNEPGFDELKTIIQTAKGGADMVTKLLAFGQQAPMFPVNLDLNHQISQLTSLVSRTLPQVVQIDLDLVDGPATIHADPNQIDQILMNLAINASEAMPDGGRVKISTRTVSFNGEYCRGHHGLKPGSYVMLSVMDTGRGMDKETLSRIFEPFFSTKQRGSTRGTGLGLSVVQGIVQQHDGHIDCESEPGKGTGFKVYFPAIEEHLEPTKEVAPTVQSGGSETILVVEDNIPVADLEQRFLASAGYTVIVATNGREALDIYRSRREEISLVVLDLLMPEMSGRDCLMELLKIDPSVKVLIASGYAPEDELHKEIRPLVKGFLQKPFAMAELVKEVRSGLDGDKG